MGRTLVQWASHPTWSAPRHAACIGISQQWRANLTDGNSVNPAQVTSIKKNFINLTVLAGDRNSILVYSFTEGSKNVRHLPRYLSIQRDPEFFSAYHH